MSSAMRPTRPAQPERLARPVVTLHRPIDSREQRSLHVRPARIVLGHFPNMAGP